MNCENNQNQNKKTIRNCPNCHSKLIIMGLYWCSNCKKWYEEIDFLNLSEEEIDDDCKKCCNLSVTEFKKDNLPLFYCNSLKTDRLMERIRDFRKCDVFDPT